MFFRDSGMASCCREGEKDIAAINLSAVTPLDHSPR